MTQEQRVAAIALCWENIVRAIAAQEPGGWTEFLWELDQRRELHRLLYSAETPSA